MRLRKPMPTPTAMPSCTSRRANVLHTGDVMMSIGYPVVDVGNGGSLAGLMSAQEKALKVCNDRTRVIPGHGPS
jgi:cyclase